MWPDGPERKILSRKNIPQNIDRNQPVRWVDRDVHKSALTWGANSAMAHIAGGQRVSLYPEERYRKDSHAICESPGFQNDSSAPIRRRVQMRSAVPIGGRVLSEHPTTEASNRTTSLIRVRPEKSERRFYVLAVDVDLFGCVLLVRHWGRLGTSGRMKLECHQSVPAALVALATLERSKRRRGYWDRSRAWSD